MSKIIHIYLIRHARQNSPLCNVNVPLAEAGIVQSELVGERLKAYNIDKVYSSNLIRAKMTAAIIREKLGLPSDDNGEYERIGLRETDFGELTGLPDEIIKVKYKDYFNQREYAVSDLRIPGGENGEEVYKRMNKEIEEIINEAISDNYSNVAVVTHGGAIRCYLAGLLGMPFGKRFTIAKTMENCSITQINYNTELKNYSVERINDYAHLDGHRELLRETFK